MNELNDRKYVAHAYVMYDLNMWNINMTACMLNI